MLNIDLMVSYNVLHHSRQGSHYVRHTTNPCIDTLHSGTPCRICHGDLWWWHWGESGDGYGEIGGDDCGYGERG